MNKQKVKQIFAGMLNSGSLTDLPDAVRQTSRLNEPSISALSMSLALRQELYKRDGLLQSFQSSDSSRLSNAISSTASFTEVFKSFPKMNDEVGDDYVGDERNSLWGSGETAGISFTGSIYHYYLGQPISSSQNIENVTAREMPYVIYSWDGPQANYSPGWYNTGSAAVTSSITFSGSSVASFWTGSYTGSFVTASIVYSLPSSSTGADRIDFFSGSALSTILVASGSISGSFDGAGSATLHITRSAIESGLKISYISRARNCNFMSGGSQYGFAIWIRGLNQS